MRGLLIVLAALTLIVSMVVLATVKPQPPETFKPLVTKKKPVQSVEPVEEEVDPMVDLRVAMRAARVRNAVCILQPTAGHSATGTVRFQENGDGVSVAVTIHGLEPRSTHGFHIHEFGDLSAADGTSTGGHYNPEGHNHAMPNSGLSRHAGDLGNVTADEDGSAKLLLTVDNISINGLHNPVLGRGIILHAKADDGSQPTGAAGARIAMGVIGVSPTKVAHTEEAIEEPDADEPIEIDDHEEEEVESLEDNTAPAAPLR